jgi:plasmid stabilization system protein ParE
MAVRLNRQVKAELDDIWLYIAVESSSLEIADRVVETITDTFLQLSKHPNLGRRRDDIRKGLRSINAGSYVVIYRTVDATSNQRSGIRTLPRTKTINR